MWMDPGKLRKHPLRWSVPGQSASMFAERAPHGEAGFTAEYAVDAAS